MKKVISLVSNDIELHTMFTKIGFFDDVRNDTTINSLTGVDILLVSDMLIPYSQFLERDFRLNTVNNIFYLVSSENRIRYESIKTVLSTKGVIVIPPHLTISQIVERVCFESGLSQTVNKNIAVFIGADNNVGTSITTQAIAECISNNSNNASVCLLILNGNPGTEYINSDKSYLGLDGIKVKVINGILSGSELIDSCIKKDNLYILPGANAIKDARHYHPDQIEKLIDLASKSFDVVLIDAGSKLGILMSIGAINSTNNRFLITTQSTKVLNNFERTRQQILNELDIDVESFLLIVNKFVSTPGWYTAAQLAELYKATLVGIIPKLIDDYANITEKEKHSLLVFDEREYNSQITELAKVVAKQTNLQFNPAVAKKQSIISRLFR